MTQITDQPSPLEIYRCPCQSADEHYAVLAPDRRVFIVHAGIGRVGELAGTGKQALARWFEIAKVSPIPAETPLVEFLAVLDKYGRRRLVCQQKPFSELPI